MRKEESKTFVGRIELAKHFRTAPQVVEATVSYTLIGRTPRFLAIEVDGEEIPLRQASESSLLKAYLRRSPIAI